MLFSDHIVYTCFDSVLFFLTEVNTFSGPEGTCFEGGVFPAKLIFPPDYPLSPPKMQFTCEMFHPNSKISCYTSHNSHHFDCVWKCSLTFLLSSLCRWKSLHKYIARTWWRPDGLRKQCGKVESGAECRENIVKCGEYVGWTKWRERRERRCR